jgi:hypothetical protein
MERPRITIRVPQKLLEEIQADLARGLIHSPDPAVDVTDWILLACRERLDHRQRSRTKRRARRDTAERELLDQRYTLAPEHERGDHE